ncbi:restriction endonuclease subunit S, partial [uncultured Succiniclasticum sp.]|uniref:restriction endonuclease subunit S n=1 Tax=uncultured Succiniclasticum sp. TaxID=1500547 RepID=UPI0025D4D51A
FGFVGMNVVNKKWNYKKLGDVCTVERGGSPRPIDDYITDNPAGINWIKIGDTNDESMFITQTAQKILPEGMKKSRYVRPGDFLLSNSMSFGRPYILKIDGCIHDGWLVLRDKENVFDKRFLYYYLSSKPTYQKFKMMAVGGVVNNLNSEMVRGVDVPIPGKDEQVKIADVLDKISRIIAYKKKELVKSDDLIKARFVEMFRYKSSGMAKIHI